MFIMENNYTVDTNYTGVNHPLIGFVIFILIFFVYLHITAQWKKSEDLEVYEIDFVNQPQLQEVCEIKQPVLFKMDHASSFYQRVQLPLLAKYDALDVKIKDIYDYYNPATTTVESLVLPFHSARKLTESDTKQRYISENNGEFIDESGLGSLFSTLNEHLRPDYAIFTKYDVMFGSNHAATPLQYHTHSRYYLTVTSGKIHVKMTPWKSSKYLYPSKNYETLEYTSPIQVWNPQHKYLGEMEKLRFLEFDVFPGYVLSVPPFWWYSFQYTSDATTTVCSFQYNTAMNSVANSYDWTLYYLKKNNIQLGGGKTETSIPAIDDEPVIDTSVKPASEVIEIELGQRANIPLPPVENKQIVTNSGIYNV